MKSRIKQSKVDDVFDVINYTLLFIILLIFLYPLIFVVSASISDPNAVWNGELWLLPKKVSLTGYYRTLKNNEIWIGYRNSLFYMVIGTSINLIMTITAAYPLSRKNFYPRSFLTAIYTFTMFFGGGLIPTYLLIKQLKMLDTVWVMVIPNAVAFWNIIITRTYFQTNIPEELREAASIDGCSNIKFLNRVVLPLSTPIIAVMALFYGVGHWNAYFNGMIYLQDRSKFPLQLILREILVLSQLEQDMLNVDPKDMMERLKVAETMKYAVIIVASVPVLMIYPFVQKHFVKGVMVGSIKG